MIKAKDLVNRVYMDRRCIGFEYPMANPNIDPEETGVEDRTIHLVFVSIDGDCKNWRLGVNIPRDEFEDGQAYAIRYEMPMKFMRIEVVAATGMKYLQAVLQQEIQRKTAIDFAMGELLEGM